MERKINIRQTFKTIREMPLEVSLNQVEVWLQMKTPRHLSLFEKLQALFKKYF